MNKLLIDCCCIFIPKEKNRKHFRDKYGKYSIFELLFLNIGRLERMDNRMDNRLERMDNRLERMDIMLKYKPYSKANIKILVAYHKQYTLWHHPYLVPIHCGKKNTKNKIIDQWTTDNMFSDDIGDNISHLNADWNEMTALYWAWKNYEKLTNPDYIGLFHYRRLFDLDDVEQVMNYDILISNRQFTNPEQQYTTAHGNNILDTLHSFYNDSLWDEFLSGNDMYFCNMFICKKNIFFEYCEWIFPILFELEKRLEQNKQIRYPRDIGFLAERLTGFFMWKKIEKDKVSYKETKIIYYL